MCTSRVSTADVNSAGLANPYAGKRSAARATNLDAPLLGNAIDLNPFLTTATADGTAHEQCAGRREPYWSDRHRSGREPRSRDGFGTCSLGRDRRHLRCRWHADLDRSLHRGRRWPARPAAAADR